MSDKILVYIKLEEDEEISGTNKAQTMNERIFDIINSDMTRGRTLEDIIGTLPDFKNILNQLKPGTKIVGIGCGEKNTERDIKKLHPDVEVYGIDIKNTGAVPGVYFSKQNLLENITLPSQTKVVYSFYTFQYLPNPLKTIEEIYNQLDIGGIAILHMGPIGIINSEIGEYINKHNNSKDICHFQTNAKDINATKYNTGDYIILHKRKENNKPIDMPPTKSYRLDKIAVKGANGKVHINANGDLMYRIDIDRQRRDTHDAK